jgi:hypothetical protein
MAKGNKDALAKAHTAASVFSANGVCHNNPIVVRQQFNISILPLHSARKIPRHQPGRLGAFLTMMVPRTSRLGENFESAETTLTRKKRTKPNYESKTCTSLPEPLALVGAYHLPAPVTGDGFRHGDGPLNQAPTRRPRSSPTSPNESSCRVRLLRETNCLSRGPLM